MTEYQVKLTKKAYEELEEIGDYIANELMAPETAISILDLLEGTIRRLATMPARYQLVDDEPWGAMGIRKMTVKNFLVYYWIDEEKKKVQVTAVLHVLQNQQRHLVEMELE